MTSTIYERLLDRSNIEKRKCYRKLPVWYRRSWAKGRFKWVNETYKEAVDFRPTEKIALRNVKRHAMLAGEMREQQRVARSARPSRHRYSTEQLVG